jgi:predicted unusual protein kinase regulating ubiquinone biosynthesis (AarF/ABC1/UbiB family)
MERIARIGWMAGELAVGGVVERVRQLTGVSEAATSAFLTATNAQRLARRLSAMRGAAMKLGQLLSMEGEDFLPPEVTEALAILRSNADSMPEAQLNRVLGRNYGKGWQKCFRHFEMTPVAAASIGQVHRAIALDGTELALKIQYPGVSQSIDSDVNNVAALLRMSRLLPGEIDLTMLVREAKRQLHAETDYRAEADRLHRYGALVNGTKGVVVPRVHPDLTTGHILAMDFVDGESLDVLSSDTAPQSVRDRIGTHLYDLMLRELFEFRFMQSDPNFANYMFLPSTKELALLDFGAAREVPEPLSRFYARIFASGMNGDRTGLRQVMGEVGFFSADERRDRVDALVDLFHLGCEPFRHRGRYDFGASTLPERARELGMDLTFKKRFFRPPPPETMFLHRKLGGTFLLCARLGARVNVKKLLQTHLERMRTEADGSGRGSRVSEPSHTGDSVSRVQATDTDTAGPAAAG